MRYKMIKHTPSHRRLRILEQSSYSRLAGEVVRRCLLQELRYAQFGRLPPEKQQQQQTKLEKARSVCVKFNLSAPSPAFPQTTQTLEA